MDDAMAEFWLPVVDYEGLYEVSDLGRVRSLPRKGGNNRLYGGKILTPVPINKLGHLSVSLSRDGVTKQHLVHRLVMAAFTGPCPEGEQVRHWDGKPANNQWSNLLYGTPSEDGYDRVRHGTHQNAIKTHCKRGHEFTPENTQIGSHGERNCRICGRAIRRATYWRNRTPESLAKQRKRANERNRRKRAERDGTPGNE